MQIKIVTTWILGFVIACAICGCKQGQRIKLIACKDIVSLNTVTYDDILASRRPKVVSSISITGFQKLDIQLLRKQISDNPEFDFLFYLLCGDMDCREMVKQFMQETQLSIIVLLDKEDKYRRVNNIPSKCTYATSITDANLIRVGVALPGFRLSPFDNVMNNARKRLDL